MRRRAVAIPACTQLRQSLVVGDRAMFARPAIQTGWPCFHGARIVKTIVAAHACEPFSGRVCCIH